MLYIEPRRALDSNIMDSLFNLDIYFKHSVFAIMCNYTSLVLQRATIVKCISDGSLAMNS